jgi:hypothetical protein
MSLIEQRTLVAAISPPIDTLLATQLVDEFVSIERRYIQCDWEPAELDGGQFAEVLARILYHQDSGTLNLSRQFSDCCEYIVEDQNRHAIQPRHGALHIVKVLHTIYKFRSQRGAVHISPSYGPNHMDAKFMVEAVRWCMNETLRIFWTGDREAVARAIRELLQFDVPCVGKFEQVLLVQRTDLSAEEEVLVLLHYAGEKGFERREIGAYAKAPHQRVGEALKRLESPEVREIITLPSGAIRLTDLGAKRVRERLADKLLLH